VLPEVVTSGLGASGWLCGDTESAKSVDCDISRGQKFLSQKIDSLRDSSCR
jgi:hypothetical protein